MCAKRERGKGKKRIEGRWGECLAYLIVFTLLLCFSASASAVAPGSPMVLPLSLHDCNKQTESIGIVLDQKKDVTQVVMRAVVARVGLLNPLFCVGSKPTDSIVQVP